MRRNIAKVVVADAVFQASAFTPPVHYLVNHASGKSIAIEVIGGKLHVPDNPLEIMANSPSFDWHMTTLRGDVNLTLVNPAPVTIGGVKLQPFGMGAGMLGLSGDFTPQSRFVRAAAFATSVEPVPTGDDAMPAAFHVVADYTTWTSAYDLVRRRFLFRTYDNSRIRSVELMKLDLNAKGITRFSMKGKEQIQSHNP